MIIDKLKKEKENFVVIDSIFPQKEPFAFRNAEIGEYFKRIEGCYSYTMYPMMPDNDSWFDHGYGVEEETYEQNKIGYLKHYAGNKDKIRYLKRGKRYRFGLAYSFFLGETYVLLPFYEKNKIPFVFVLYPGGCFGLDNDGSDKMLAKIFNSKYFRGVIVTQKITHDYLIRKKLCEPQKIHYIYGGFVQFKKEQVQKKLVFNTDKKTIDICFVAAKYTDGGVDKGYDVFVETAKLLAKQNDYVRFHVVGGFDKTDIDITGIEDKFMFYGYKKPDFLISFYASMDIFIGPGRHSQIFPGNFDGFPLGIDAGYCGVALFVSDDLNMNQYYTDKQDIVLIDHNPENIATRVMDYINNPNKLKILSKKCMTKTQMLFDMDKQVNERIKVYRQYATIKVD